jgi:hypothetical protein
MSHILEVSYFLGSYNISFLFLLLIMQIEHCAANVDPNVDSGGVRSWIATGRNGEVYMAFFNLSDQQNTTIYAKTSFVSNVLPDKSINSCQGKEVWSGKDVLATQGTITMDVEVHGCALFVLSCK